jgi:hypothetical protein
MDEQFKPTKTKADLSKFWVITCVSNPMKYRRRFELFWRFEEMCKASGVNLIVVEQAFGHRHFMLTKHNYPYHLQVRTVEVLWHKENMLNLGIQHAVAMFGSENVREVAWIDADCRPARPPREWFEDTWHALQHYEFVQMWENLLSLDYFDNPVDVPGPSFMANYVKYGKAYPPGIIEQEKLDYGYGDGPKRWGSPGLAWAANRDALDKIGGLPQQAILGAGDWYLAHMLTDGLMLPVLSRYTDGYRNSWLRQQALCERWIKRDVGYVKGLVLDDWHGKKINRGYNTRENIFINNQYDPTTDIKIDSQGLIQLETWDERQIRMRDQIRAYFSARQEDDISL